MATGAFTLSGDDPLLSPDNLTGAVDPALDPSAPDPLQTLVLDPGNASLYPSAGNVGPTIAQLGANPNSAAVIGTQAPADPSAVNANSTTNTTSGTSIWDTILGVGKIAAAITPAFVSKGSQTTSATQNAAAIANAKGTSGAGTSSSLVWIVVIAFVGLFLWLEFEH